MIFAPVTDEQWAKFMNTLQPYVTKEYEELAATIPGPDRELALAIAMTRRDLPESLEIKVSNLGDITVREALETPEGIAHMKIVVVEERYPKPYWVKQFVK